MANAQRMLRDFVPTKSHFVGIDSDGCVFNSMEVKHRDCFGVALVRSFGLAAVSRQVHEAWDFVNLYSQSRGANRFRAIVATFDLLRAMPRVKASGLRIPELAYVREWISTETLLGNPRLTELVNTADGDKRAELAQALEWSLLINTLVKETVKSLPPFPYVMDSLEMIQERADAMVISSTPAEALHREWAEHGMDKYVSLIAGQEMGSKTEHLTLATGDKYDASRVLMIGDAPGDMKAARDVGAFFFPICPGSEEDSWKLFRQEALERFFDGTYGGAYESRLIAGFMALLPSEPPWAHS